MQRFQVKEDTILVIQQGDLTKWKGDAIVNAANERMLGGGGVDGAIHRAAGRELYEACLKVPEVSKGKRCPTGEARITPGFKLPAKHVIHTVGPIYTSASGSAPLLQNAFSNSMKLAQEHDLQTIAFPAISCGVFGYPLYDAAEVAMATIKSSAGTLKEVHFVLFGPDTMQAFGKAAAEAFPPMDNSKLEL